LIANDTRSPVWRNIEFAAHQGANHVAQRLSYAADRPFGKPNQVSILITDACAARCLMCDIWKLDASGELTVDEWKPILDDLREWLGPFFLVISGGEPFQKPGIFEFLGHCRDIGIKTKMSTNGMFLSNRRYLDQIMTVGPDFLSFSIDHHDRAVHDRLRGVALYDRCVEAIDVLRRESSQMVLGVATIIMEENSRELARTAEWALGLGVDRMLFQPLYPTFASDEGMDPNWTERNPHWPRDSEAVSAELDRVKEMKAAGAPIWNPDEHLVALQHYFRDPWSHPRPDECMVRYNAFNIDPKGDVSFCYTVNDRAGSLRTERARDIWESALAQQIRDKMKPCKAPCLLNCYRGRSLREQVGLFKLFAERQGF
jgi:MoaA/NifB/PqqE/SkfB family radical SAM enzyme